MIARSQLQRLLLPIRRFCIRLHRSDKGSGTVVGVALAFLVIWSIFVSDRPQESRWANDAEKDYLALACPPSKHVCLPFLFILPCKLSCSKFVFFSFFFLYL